jgi:hypothetical protein
MVKHVENLKLEEYIVPVGSDISGPHRSFCGAMNMKFREKDFLSFMRYMFVRSLFFFPGSGEVG